MHKDAYSSQPVPDLLRPFIRRFMVANHQTKINETVYPKPTGYSYLNWIVEGLWQVECGVDFSSEKAPIFFAGQIKGEDFKVTQTGYFKHIVTEFTALGFYQLTGIKGVDCLNKLRLPQLCTAELGLQFDQLLELSQQLSSAKELDIDNHLRLLEVSLLTMVGKPHTVPDYLIQGVEQIELAHGFITINEMCENLDISQRQFSRLFTEVVGFAPKHFARVLQINKALQALLENDREYLCHIANEAGYYDESHYIRVFQDFFDDNPSQFLNSEQETLFTFLGESRSLAKD